MQTARQTAYALDRAASTRVQRLTAAPAEWPSAADQALRSRLLATLQNQRWWDADVSNVIVVDGTAIFQGLLGKRADRVAARAVAMAVPGVQAVRDDRVRAQQWMWME